MAKRRIEQPASDLIPEIEAHDTIPPENEAAAEPAESTQEVAESDDSVKTFTQTETKVSEPVDKPVPENDMPEEDKIDGMKTPTSAATDITTEPQPEEELVPGRTVGWEKVDQQAHNADLDLEGKTIKGEDGGEYVFKKIVTKQMGGADIEKVVPVRVADEKTLYMNDDVNAINDWDDRRFIIDKIEGIYEEVEGRACCMVPGMWDILNNYALHYIKKEDLPDHVAFREAADDYQRQFFRKQKFNVEMNIDYKLLIALWFEACLWQCKTRLKELKEELSAGQIDQRQFGNAKQLLDMAENAIRKYQAGQIKL